MKYSGVEWIGEIPDNWTLVRLKDICINKKEVAGEKSSEYERLALTLNGVIKRPKDDQEGLQPKKFDTYQILEVNDFVFKMIDLQNISTSRVGLSPYTGLVSPAYIRFASKKKEQFNEFIYYYLLSLWHNCVYNNIADDGVRSALNATDIGNLKCPYPTENQQRNIAVFLNQKTNEIDSLIRIENQQIEKLKEYKQAVITEAVTKGLNKNAVMKDSGIERIGKIPESWKTASTKSIFEIIAGATPDTGNIDNWDGNIIWITPADYKTEDVFVNSGRRNLSQLGYDSCSTTLIPPGNIIFSKRAPIGLIAINNKELCTNQGCLSCINKQNISIKYFYYQMSAYTKYYELFGCGTTFKEISAQKFGNFSLVFPPKYAQEDIVKYLDAKCDDIAKLIEIKQQKIELLAKYKKSIIYECVTGKKETS